MASSNFGHCKHCRYFASPSKRPLELEEAPCTEPRLRAFGLITFGASGCNAFTLREGLSERVELPPTVPL